MISGRNELARPIREDILEKLAQEQFIDETYAPFGDGRFAEKIVEALDRIVQVDI